MQNRRGALSGTSSALARSQKGNRPFVAALYHSRNLVHRSNLHAQHLKRTAQSDQIDHEGNSCHKASNQQTRYNQRTKHLGQPYHNGCRQKQRGHHYRYRRDSHRHEYRAIVVHLRWLLCRIGIVMMSRVVALAAHRLQLGIYKLAQRVAHLSTRLRGNKHRHRSTHKCATKQRQKAKT